MQLKNILLTKNMEAKLSSFTLSKTLPKDETKVFTEVAGSGSMAYMDPEYMIGGMLSSSSDIYGFGVVTLQVLSGDVGAVESIATRELISMSYLCGGGSMIDECELK
ncbi:Wall-associated receptor kinase 3 [Acorus gramineus]|uniref:Wall-associated receptor kinase 3 n=1 Tax=Acorus gramineus TaxID=55184 RepID=A0AAV9B6M3_ACOGR|nr:Wall-associated receptor kinase 3 [Acorus gramineus]